MKYDMESCPYEPLTELLTDIIDNRGKTVPTCDKGHKLIATNCIRNENLYPTYEKIRYLSDETYKTWFRAHPIPGDIIFVNKGTPGRVCMVPDPIDFCIAQDMIAFRSDERKIYNKFLFAVLRSETIQSQIYNFNVGDVIPHFKKSFLDKIMIPLPEMQIQRVIGDFYYNLSYKIELNNHINKNLEAQAQAIFKSWFVDFEPFRDGEFVDSELGPIPKGWRVGKLSDIGTIIGGATPSKAKDEYYIESKKGIAWITPKDLSVNKNKFISHGEIDITPLGYRSSSTKLMPAGSVLFSSRAPIGYMAIADNELCTNQGFKSIIPERGIGTSFVYYTLKSNLDTIQSLGSGSTFKEVSGSVMKNLSILIPDLHIVYKFEKLCKTLLSKQRSLEYQNQALTDLRDTLLPKLMSGEIEVPTT